jgi:hypothetical protein
MPLTQTVGMSLTKIDIVEAQLSAAIRMYFENAHPVPVHTLACAAREIMSVLGEKLEMDTFLDEFAYFSGENVKDLRKRLTRFWNFMKHADRDPADVLSDFSDRDNDLILFCVCRDLALIAKGLPIEAQVFEVWFFAATVRRVSAGGLRWQKHIKACIRCFPLGFRTASRSEKKQMGLAALTRALKKPQYHMEMIRAIEIPNE